MCGRRNYWDSILKPETQALSSEMWDSLLIRRAFNINEFVSDQKLLLIICAVPFPQDRGKAITQSHVNGLHKSVPSQAVAQKSNRTTNQVKVPDGWWNKGNESRWYSRVEELQTGLAQPTPYASLFALQGKFVNRVFIKLLRQEEAFMISKWTQHHHVHH